MVQGMRGRIIKGEDITVLHLLANTYRYPLARAFPAYIEDFQEYGD